MTSGRLWNFYRDKVDDAANETAAGYWTTNNRTITSRSFEYKAKVIGRTPANNNMLKTDVVAPSKYLNKVWRSLDLSLINCEIELDFSRSEDCVISDMSRMLLHLLAALHQHELLMQYFK